MTKIKRLVKIIIVLTRFRLDELIPGQQLPWYISIMLNVAPWRLIPAPKLSRGARLRHALENLGPVFVKFGQILSTRRDLLPDDIANELRPLQDQVTAFDSELAQKRIEAALGKPINEIFAEFESKPLASASIAQVHGAVLHSGEPVVVKVIRPDIQSVIKQDIALMEGIAGFLERHIHEAKRLRPVEVVADYKQVILDELDLQREAANAAQLRRNFANSDMLYIPKVYWDFTRENIMVMERIAGIPVADLTALRAQNTNMEMLAQRGVEIFFTQVFRDSFFHADMHPGNIFVSYEHPEQPKYIAVDFGIIGTLTEEDQSYLAQNLIAFFNRDYRRVAVLHVESGWVPEETRVEELEAAIRTVCEPIFEKPIKEISFGHVLLRLFQTARRFNVQVQPQLVLLQKTLLNIEGLGRQLYPDLDLWKTAKPFLEQRLKEKLSPKNVWRHFQKNAPPLLEQLPHIPQLVLDAMQQVKQTERYHSQQQLLLQNMHVSMEQQRKQQVRSQQAWALLAVSILFFVAPEGLPIESGIAQILGLVAVFGSGVLFIRNHF